MRRPSPNPRGELTIVEHLEELHVRLLVSLAAFAVALALCFSQNHRPRVKATFDRVMGAVLTGLGVRPALEHR